METNFRVNILDKFRDKTSMPVGKPIVNSFLSISQSNLNSPFIDSFAFVFPPNNSQNPKEKAIIVDITVANPAPNTPILRPLILVPGIVSNINTGSKIILVMEAIIIIFIGVLASPKHLKAVLTEKD